MSFDNTENEDTGTEIPDIECELTSNVMQDVGTWSSVRFEFFIVFFGFLNSDRFLLVHVTGSD